LRDFVKAVNETILDQLDMEMANHLIYTLSIMIDSLIKTQEKGVNIDIAKQYLKDFFYMIIRSIGAYNNFKLVGKVEP